MSPPCAVLATPLDCLPWGGVAQLGEGGAALPLLGAGGRGVEAGPGVEYGGAVIPGHRALEPDPGHALQQPDPQVVRRDKLSGLGVTYFRQ